ncbi:hypothetical protein HDV05_004631 [Chytridiales sp. JEL 0842]|nr:hypothetical protein HDV05_004631 [Chytridiales sp. JEL 0842]
MSSSSSSTSNPPAPPAPAQVEHHAIDDIDTVDTPARYLGLLGRLRNIAFAQSRLLAYTSEIGEAFRPVIPKPIVNGAYAVSWAYVLADVGLEGYKTHTHTGGNKPIEVARTVLERGIFQSLASMVLPAYSVHFLVHQSAKYFSKRPNVSPMLLRYGPTGVGLGLIPFLPTIFDEPVEKAVESFFGLPVWL